MTTILLIEDNPDIRETLADILQFEGYDVLAAGDGREALHSLESAATLPQVIVLDLMMPVMCGRECREQLRQHPAWQLIPIVLCSGNVDTPMTAGMEPLAGILRKPVDVPELLALLAKCCASEPEVSNPVAPSAEMTGALSSVLA